MQKSAKAIMMTGLMALSLTALNPGNVLAEDKPEADLSMGAYSQYVWRGFAFSDSSVVLQPSMTVSYKGFAANLWGNLDTDETGLETANWNETDMTLSYDGAVGKIGYGAGWIYYNVDGAADTQEVYASISADVILSPTLTYYTDIAHLPGSYVTLGISHSLAITKAMALDLGAQVGYLDDEADYSELHDGLLSASMTFTVSEYVSVTPELYYSFALTDEAETAIKAVSYDAEDSHFYGGVSASLAF
ncbi:MAG: hypothetical protein KAS94_15045 [Desulfobulbaceae bacterium]|nr:hypothetical protein [Desulfobulbaceae bacterium]